VIPSWGSVLAVETIGGTQQGVIEFPGGSAHEYRGV
jgi:hypothetical protein